MLVQATLCTLLMLFTSALPQKKRDAAGSVPELELWGEASGYEYNHILYAKETQKLLENRPILGTMIIAASYHNKRRLPSWLFSEPESSNPKAKYTETGQGTIYTALMDPKIEGEPVSPGGMEVTIDMEYSSPEGASNGWVGAVVAAFDSEPVQKAFSSRDIHPLDSDDDIARATYMFATGKKCRNIQPTTISKLKSKLTSKQKNPALIRLKVDETWWPGAKWVIPVDADATKEQLRVLNLTGDKDSRYKTTSWEELLKHVDAVTTVYS